MADPVAVVALAALGTGLAIWGLFRERRRRLLDDLPTVGTAGLFIGQVEAAGTAAAGDAGPLTAPFCAERCVWYEARVDERWRRTSITTDSKGRTQVRTTYGWSTVDERRSAAAFRLADADGAVAVLPDGAEMDGERLFSAGAAIRCTGLAASPRCLAPPACAATSSMASGPGGAC